MSRTLFLLAIAAVVILMQLFPARAPEIKWLAVSLGLAYLGVRALLTYPKLYRRRKNAKASRAEEDQQFKRYTEELNSIRSRHDPDGTLGENTPLPPAFKEELADLYARHRSLLDKRFGHGSNS